VITVLIPLILKYFFDIAIVNGQEEIIFSVFLFLLLYVVYFILTILGNSINVISSEFTVRNVQEEFFIAIHEKNMAFHDTSRTGELLSMATADSRQLSWMFFTLRMLFLAVFTTLGVFISMAVLDSRLVIIFLLFLPFILLSMRWYAKRMAPISIKRQILFASWQATLQENIAGVRTLRTLSNAEREFEKYVNDLDSVRNILIRRAKISAEYLPTILIYTLMGITFIVGGIFVFEKTMSFGTLIAFNGLVLLLQRPNQMIRSSVFLGSMGFAGGTRVFNVLNTRMQIENGDFKIKNRLKGDIIFENVSFRYENSGNYILKELSFSITAGETVALIGHTGCGKTTLTKLIQRLYDPNKGLIKVDGLGIKNYDLDDFRRQVGVIEQDIFLFSASIKENILFGFAENITPDLERKMIEVTKAAQIHDFVMNLPNGYDTIIGERGVTLSGGQKQRIAIARAFMIDSPILIMDDATASVDAKTENQIQIAIKNLLQQRTTIIITHRLSTVKNADKIIFMEAGRIKDIGSHNELYQRQKEYRSIFLQYEDLPLI
jgi:ATP-binding cassette subfamily B protein